MQNYLAYIIAFQRNDNTGYIGIDTASGGYTFETDSFVLARLYTDINKAIHTIKSLTKQTTIPSTTYTILGLKTQLIKQKELDDCIKDSIIERAYSTFTNAELSILVKALNKDN